jgi:hypothetical protein
MPFGFAEAIGLGSSLLGGFLGNKSQKRAISNSNYWNQQSLDFEREKFTRGIQTRVNDAKAAGIHPLYALGAPGAGSPSFTSGGGGNALGDGIANAGRALQPTRGKANPLQQELIRSQIATQNSQAAKNVAEATYYDAQAKLSQDRAMNTTRDLTSMDFAMPVKSRGASTSRRSSAGTSIGRVTSRNGNTYITDPKGRRIRVEPHQDLPEQVSAQNLRGRRKVLNPDLGLDEVGQLEYMLRPWWEQLKAMQFMNPMQPKRHAPWANKFYYWKNRRKRR